MKTPEEMRLEKVLDLMADLQLNDSQMDLVEEYFTGDQEIEALAQLPFINLSKQPPETEKKSENLFDEFIKRGRKEEVSKLFEVIFQIGQSTCAPMLCYTLKYLKLDEWVETEPAKRVMVRAEVIGMNQHWQIQVKLQELITMARNDWKVVKEAIGYFKSEATNSLILLWALYFYLKYHSSKKKLEKEDEEKLQAFEGLLVRNIDTLFDGNVAEKDLEIFQEYVKNQSDKELDLPDSVKKLAQAYTMTPSITSLLCGCAFLNFPLSPVLRNFLRLSIASDMQKTLYVLDKYDINNDLAVRGGDYDSLFHMDTMEYILWAARNNHRNILRYQLKHNRQKYLDSVYQSEAEENVCLLAVIKGEDKALYQDILNTSMLSQREKVIKVVVPDQKPSTADVCQYLRGGAKVETIYPWREDLTEVYCYGGRERKALEHYKSVYGQDEFFSKCIIVLFFRNIRNFFYFLEDNHQRIKERTKELFENLQKEGLLLNYQIECAQVIYEEMYGDKAKEGFYQAVLPVFLQYLKDYPEETLRAMKSAGAAGRYIAVGVLGLQPDKYKEALLEFCQDTSKIVKEALISELYKHPEWKEDILGLLKSKKSADREMAIRVIKTWNGDDYKQLLKEALETEKSSKLQKLLKEILEIEEEKEPGQAKSASDFIKEIHKGGKKRTLAWAYLTPFSVVHMKNGEAASEEYMQALLLCYATMSIPGVNKEVYALADQLDERELNLYMNELFDKWIEEGAESKKKWVLYATSVHGGGDIVVKLEHYINEWPKHARGSIAAEAVKALALNSSPTALLIVDGISRKFKFKQIKAAAGLALEFAASQLGLGKEELADKIVPDLGFNERMERVFDYGERKFTVMITPALEIEIYDDNKKKLKNMPAPGKRDDEVKANGAYAEFKQLKRQMKTTVTNQKMRLEQALSIERKWTTESWKALFVNNPIMHQFAISLIWGVYEDGQLTATFRYMEDGTFNTEDEEEYTLPDNGQIGLVHPIELTEESREKWQEQLDDYEVMQSIEQLNRPVYKMTEEEQESRQLERFGGMIINDLSLAGKLTSFGWYRGSVLDAGGFDTYYREDSALGLGVELNFSGSFVGGMDEEVTIYGARFYKAETIKHGSYLYDEVTLEKAYPLKEVPPRYFSEIVYQLTKATKSSKERVSNWKDKR